MTNFPAREPKVILEEDDDGEDVKEEEPQVGPTKRWSNKAQPRETVPIDVGRGEPIEVPVGSPFRETVERLSDQAHYGGYFRVFLNGSEVVNPEDAPETVEAGMRIAITSYDKPG